MSIYKTGEPKPAARRKHKKGCLVGCATALLYVAVANSLPYLYTPPALTAEKVAAYSKAVNYITTVRTRYRLQDVTLHALGVDTFLNNNWVDAHKHLQEKDIQRGERLGAELNHLRCSFSRSEEDMILFLPARSFFLPTPAGVLYSVKGRDPNIAGDRVVASLRPFRRIDGRWFAFKHNWNQGHLPQSVFDLTLNKPGQLGSLDTGRR